jgi:hypothetical protein
VIKASIRDIYIEKMMTMDKNRQILKENIDKAVRKAISENIRKERTLDSLVESVLHENLNKLFEDDKKSNKKRSVIQWLQKPEVNTAEIRRRVEGEPESQEEEDTKRSYFMKKVNQSNGKDFSDEEVNQLYAVKSELGQ